jgi:hypothetical protein
MARAASGKRRGKKATKRKRKVAVSRKTHPPQRGTSDNTPLRVANMPPFQDTSNLDVANEIAARRRNQIAAHQPASPEFPGNIPPQQFASALLADEGSLTAEAAIGGGGRGRGASPPGSPLAGSPVTRNAEIDPPPRLR